ncbi:MAG TPA: 30S ribosome-binding factor RbfA [Terriglobales bacterium]|nr:30S ribosome-binding factor RbfA [Terriglobales bacterium]
MPEQRGREHHRERLAEAIRDEIGAILEGELADPRIGLITVSEVKLAPDGKNAHVFVSALEQDETQSEQSLKGLQSARNYIRHELAQRLGLRTAPELRFVLDQSEQYGGRIEELLQRARRKRGKDSGTKS